MLKKIIKFLDKHRLILVLLTLFLISIIFLGVNSYLFLNHNFKEIKCTKDINDIYCYHKDIKIYKNPSQIKKEFLNNYKEELDALKEKYQLPKLNNYTSYYYQVASLLEYNMTTNNEDIYTFFLIYNNTYNLEEFYIKNTYFYQLFYNYKIPSNID